MMDKTQLMKGTLKLNQNSYPLTKTGLECGPMKPLSAILMTHFHIELKFWLIITKA